MYGLMGRIVAHPGRRSELANALLHAAALLRDANGCLIYVVSLGDDEESVWVNEVWSSSEAHAASLELEAVRALILHARPLIAAFGERFEVTPLGGLGLGG